jgi:hypothetical protein
MAQAWTATWHQVKVEWQVPKNIWGSMGFEHMTTHQDQAP